MRGIAALFVLAGHLSWAAKSLTFIRHTHLAVDFFFILSGYVISSSYEKKLQDRSLTFGSFMWRRWARLYPMIAFGTALCLLSPNPTAENIAIPFAFVAQLFLIPGVTGSKVLFPLNGPYWSLVFEILANAVHGAVARWITTLKLVLFNAASLGALSWMVYKWGGIHSGWGSENWAGGFARIGFSYSAGMLIYRLRRAGGIPPVVLPFAAVAAALAVTIGTASVMGVWWVELAASTIAFPAILIVAIDAECGPRMAWWAKTAGAISYPLYTTHQVFATLLHDPIDQQKWLLPIGVVLIILASFAIEKYYERPTRIFLDLLVRRFSRPIKSAD